MEFSQFKNNAVKTSYRHGNLYEVGSYVKSLTENKIGKIHRRGPNYVICITENGEMFRSWITDLMEYKQVNKSGDTAKHRLVGTPEYKKLTHEMAPGSEYDPFKAKNTINKNTQFKEEYMSTTVKLSSWMMSLNRNEQVEIASKIDTILVENRNEDRIIEAIDGSFGTERMKDLALEYVTIVSEGKIKGADGKACWKGYKYAGTENGKDNCVKAGFEPDGDVIEEKKKLDAVGKEDGDVDNDGDKDKSDSYLMKKRAVVSAAINSKKMKEGFSDWRSELSEKTNKYVEVSPKVEDQDEPSGTFDKNKKLKGKKDDMKEEHNYDEECACETCDSKRKSKVKRVKYADGVTEGTDMKKREDIVKGMKKNAKDFKARYGKDAKSVMYATATKMSKD
jgi:hypothetical protein